MEGASRDTDMYLPALESKIAIVLYALFSQNCLPAIDVFYYLTKSLQKNLVEEPTKIYRILSSRLVHFNLSLQGLLLLVSESEGDLLIV